MDGRLHFRRSKTPFAVDWHHMGKGLETTGQIRFDIASERWSIVDIPEWLEPMLAKYPVLEREGLSLCETVQILRQILAAVEKAIDTCAEQIEALSKDETVQEASGPIMPRASSSRR